MRCPRIDTDEVVNAGQYRFGEVHVKFVRLATERRHQRDADLLSQTTIEAFAGHKDQARIKPGEPVPPHEYPGAPTFLQVEHSHCRIVKFVLGNLKEIVSGIPLDQTLQHLYAVALLRKAATSQYVLKFLSGTRNVHYAAVVCARGKKTDKTGFSDKVTDRISMAYEKNVHIGRPVHKRAFAGLGDHHRITVFRINCDVVW